LRSIGATFRGIRDPVGQHRAWSHPAKAVPRTSRRQFIRHAGAGVLTSLLPVPVRAATRPEDVTHLLNALRLESDLPALAAAALHDGRLIASGAAGVRKYDSPEPVTFHDQFHLGSCTKALTAHLCARLMQQGLLHRKMTLAQALPDLQGVMHRAYRDVSWDHLLSHRSGFSSENWLSGRDFQELRHLPGDAPAQRARYVREILQEAPEAEPGARFIYSNRNYAVAGHLAERAAATSWERLMVREVFKPLKIQSGGFGAMGTTRKMDQPWQHLVTDRGRIAIPPGPNSDNPPAIAPGGAVHMALGDWAKFVADHLVGIRGQTAHLSLESYRYLHSPPFEGDYMGGWMATERSWGGGRVFTHSGSNTQNFAVVWMAPNRNFAVLVAANQGGEAAAKTCDRVASKLVSRLLG
jgi:CubicO group peptidase (beta-lactamase class C family)